MSDEIFSQSIFGLYLLQSHGPVREVSFAKFGEPLLDPKIVERIKYVRKMLPDVKIRLTTNGALLSRRMIHNLGHAGVNRIEVSFEGFSKTRYEALRRGLNYDEVRQNILDAIQFGRTTGRFIVTLAVTVATEDRPLVDDFRREWKKNRAWRIYFNPVHNWQGSIHAVGSTENGCCSIGWRQLMINLDGSITPCCVDYNNNLTFGHIRDGIWNVLNNGKYQAFRQSNLAGNKNANPICARCTWGGQRKWLKPCRDIVRRLVGEM